MLSHLGFEEKSWSQLIRQVMSYVPPAQGTVREALADLTNAGYTIRKG